MPDISLITPVFNGEKTIGDCVRSVRSQTCPVEHIVVDGGSTDDTLAVVHRTAGETVTVVSEPDRGMYDAVNKGIGMATGAIVGLLNADDLYASRDIVRTIHAAMSATHAQACYGDLVYVERQNTDRVKRYWKSGPYGVQRFYWGWMPPHPTFYARRELFERLGGYDLAMGTAADYELMLRYCVQHRIQPLYIERIMVRMRLGGMSNMTMKNRLRANRSDRSAWRKNGLRPYPWTLVCKPLRKFPQWLMTPRPNESIG